MSGKSALVKKLAMATLFAAAMTQLPAQAGELNIGVILSGEIQPGVYGRVEIGNAPPPPVLYAQPVVIVREHRRVPYEPIYLHVPPGHAKHWSKFCGRYNACNRPVYFVKSAEYEPDYRPREDHDDGYRGNGHGNGHGKNKHGRDDD